MSRLKTYFELWSGRLTVVGFQTMLAVHALVILSGCLLASARSRWSAGLAGLALAACSLVWFGVNQRWEGRTLMRVSATHGITQADLVVPVVLGLALGWRALRNRWAARGSGRS